MSGSLDSRAFLSGLDRLVDRIERGTDDEEERLARLAVDTADVPRDTGDLANSKVVRKSGGQGVEYGWTAGHAGFVEFGTEHMAAQPFARPAGLKAARNLKSPI